MNSPEIVRCSECSARGDHFKCQSCGMHVIDDAQPCPRCRYFRFDKLTVFGTSPRDAKLVEVTTINRSTTQPKRERPTRSRNNPT